MTTGALVPARAGSQHWPTTADFNGDGKTDLAVADSGRSNVLALLGFACTPPVSAM